MSGRGADGAASRSSSHYDRQREISRQQGREDVSRRQSTRSGGSFSHQQNTVDVPWQQPSAYATPPSVDELSVSPTAPTDPKSSTEVVSESQLVSGRGAAPFGSWTSSQPVVIHGNIPYTTVFPHGLPPEAPVLHGLLTSGLGLNANAAVTYPGSSSVSNDHDYISAAQYVPASPTRGGWVPPPVPLPRVNERSFSTSAYPYYPSYISPYGAVNSLAATENIPNIGDASYPNPAMLSATHPKDVRAPMMSRNVPPLEQQSYAFQPVPGSVRPHYAPQIAPLAPSPVPRPPSSFPRDDSRRGSAMLSNNSARMNTRRYFPPTQTLQQDSNVLQLSNFPKRVQTRGPHGSRDLTPSFERNAPAVDRDGTPPIRSSHQGGGFAADIGNRRSSEAGSATVQSADAASPTATTTAASGTDGPRSDHVMWVGNIPTDCDHDELFAFLDKCRLPSGIAAGSNQPQWGADGAARNNNPFSQGYQSPAPIPRPSGTFADEWSSGIQSIRIIRYSHCAFVNYASEAHLVNAMQQCNRKRLRPYIPTSKLLCRVREKETYQMNGVEQQQSMKLHTTWVRERNAAKTEAGSMSQEDSPQDASDASTTSDLLTAYFPTRFFILKSSQVEALEQSVADGTWITQTHIESVLDQAFRTSRQTFLIFSVIKSGEFFGYARMTSALLIAGPSHGRGRISKDSQMGNPNMPRLSQRATVPPDGVGGALQSVDRANIEGPFRPSASTAHKSRGNAGIPESSLYDEVDRIASLRLSDTIGSRPSTSARIRSAPPELLRQQGNHEASGPVLNQLPISTRPFHGEPSVGKPFDVEDARNSRSPERDARQTSPSLNLPRGSPLGSPFRLNWVKTEPLPFTHTRGLLNPWNENREIKVARDGTEIEPDAGWRLLQEWDKL